MTNGIEDLNTDLLPDSEGIKDIIITKGKDIADTKVLDTIRSLDKTGQLANIITKDDISEIREGVMTGDMQRIKDTLQFNYDKLEALSPAIVANALGYSGDPIGQGLAVGNFANEIGQILASGSEMAAKSDFGDNIFANTLERGIGAINVPIQIGTDVFDRGITAATNQYNNVMNPVLDQFGRVVRFPFQYGRNFFRNQFMDEPIRPVFKPKPDPDPVQLTNDQINQIVEDEVNLNPPTPVFSPQDRNIQPARAPAQPAFSPQDMNIQPYSPPSYVGGGGGMDYRNVVNRANGGLVAVSRYLKGR
tara:strand:+ start:3277 stop:4191 length:915 start_codon:yes stop_codon:yes gene_type:complete